MDVGQIHGRPVQSRCFLLCRSADDDEVVPWQGQCDIDISLTWMTEVSSSVYATPTITDLFSDGHKDIIIPSFVHYLEVCQGLFMHLPGLLLVAVLLPFQLVICVHEFLFSTGYKLVCAVLSG